MNAIRVSDRRGRVRVASRWWPTAGLLCAAGLTAAGCGGSARTSISLSPSALSFFLTAGSNTTQAMSITATFVGDGVVAGYAPGVTPPTWLNVAQQSTVNSGRVQFQLTASPLFVPSGSYQTSVRFATGRLPANGVLSQATQVVSADLPVTLTVGDFAVLPPAIALLAVEDSTAPPTPPEARSFTIAGAATRWTATSDSAWLTLPQTSGVGPGNLDFTVNPAMLALGPHQAHVDVHDATSGATITVAVNLTVSAPQLTASEPTLAFSVDGATTTAQVTQSFTVTDQRIGGDPARGVSWSLSAIDVPWIAGVTPTAGSSTPPSVLAVTLDVPRLGALPNGDHRGHVVLDYASSDGQHHQLPVEVTLHLALPRVRWVAPYIVYTGQTHDLIVRGTGFAGGASQPLSFGERTIDGWQAVNDSQIRIAVPALPVGETLVRIPNALGLDTGGARLLVRDPAALPTAIIASPGPLRLIFDDERQVLYGIALDSGLDRFALRAGTWTTLPFVPVANLKDAALSTDGRTLLLATFGSGLFELDLAADGASPQQTIPPQQTVAPDQLFTSVAVTEHNLAVLTTGIRGSGFTPTFTYDLTTHTLAPFPSGTAGSSLSIGLARASGDGGRILMGQNGVSPTQPVIAYDSSTGRTRSTPVSESIGQIAINRDGSRFVVTNGPWVYDGGYNLLGQLPSNDFTIAVSPDGTRAYAYSFDFTAIAAKDIEVYDLRAPAGGAGGAGGVYTPVGHLVPSPMIQPTGVGTPALAVSRDGLTLFVSGHQALQVMPLPAP